MYWFIRIAKAALSTISACLTKTWLLNLTRGAKFGVELWIGLNPTWPLMFIFLYNSNSLLSFFRSSWNWCPSFRFTLIMFLSSGSWSCIFSSWIQRSSMYHYIKKKKEVVQPRVQNKTHTPKLQQCMSQTTCQIVRLLVGYNSRKQNFLPCIEVRYHTSLQLDAPSNERRVGEDISDIVFRRTCDSSIRHKYRVTHKMKKN